jgi:AraC-like DNA-binding protein
MAMQADSIEKGRNVENYFAYLPINESNIPWDIYLTGVGVASIPAGMPYPPEGHPDVYNFNWEIGRILPEYQILLIAEGEGVFESAKTKETAVRAGDVILLFPGLWHRYRPSKDSGWKEYWLSWNGEQLYRLLKKGLINPKQAVVSVGKTEELLAIYEKILNYVRTHPAENSSILSAYAMEAMALTMEGAQLRQNPQENVIPADYVHSIDDPVVLKAMQAIWNHSYRDFRVDDIVRQLPVTRRTLERKFRQALGHSIGAEITRCRVERAKHLLTSTSLPIKHIALAVGFSNTDWMRKVFLRELGVAPSRYRQSL